MNKIKHFERESSTPFRLTRRSSAIERLIYPLKPNRTYMSGKSFLKRVSMPFGLTRGLGAIERHTQSLEAK
jgi:hypothetical protein